MRFLIFAYDHYYPEGGMNDLIGEAGTIGVAISLAYKSIETPDVSGSSSHIYDMMEGEVILRFSKQDRESEIKVKVEEQP